MRKMIALLLALGLAVSVYAAAPTAITSVANFAVDTTLTPGDTLTAAADTSTIIASFDPEQGYDYILYRTAFTGDGSDSVACQVVVENKSETGTSLYSTVVDSFTAAAGEAIDLQIGVTNFGPRFSIHVIGIADIGGEVVSPSYYLVSRKPIQYQRRY